MKLKCYVTAADIREGKKDNCTACPIARALSRAVSRATNRTVNAYARHAACGVYGQGMPNMEGLVTRPMRKFMDRFDGSLPVKPRTFKVTLNEHI